MKMKLTLILAVALFAANHDVDAFSSRPARTRSGIVATPSSSLLKLNSSQEATVLSEDSTAEPTTTEPDEESQQWAKHAILVSSFSDGVLASPDAQSFLKYSLACSLLEERVKQAETAVRDSVLASPCNGPDIGALNNLETCDEQLKESSYSDDAANQLLQSLHNKKEDITIKLIYIPTAMYALNPNSNNTPGKQRQRARADGKKKRTQVANCVHELLHLSNSNTVNVLAITLDLDDGSLKQPTGSDEASDFPTNGVEALTTWAPHIVYVEGGNTFWLHHCLEKGNWKEPLQKACMGPDATSLYIGKSAGAILAGATVETATWKGWDDPSVVPNKERYEDWKGTGGLAMVGSRSFFPHMSPDWEALVVKKKAEMEGEERAADDVMCLGELDACCVDGNAKTMTLVTGEEEQ